MQITLLSRNGFKKEIKLFMPPIKATTITKPRQLLFQRLICTFKICWIYFTLYEIPYSQVMSSCDHYQSQEFFLTGCIIRWDILQTSDMFHYSLYPIYIFFQTAVKRFNFFVVTTKIEKIKTFRDYFTFNLIPKLKNDV